MTEGTDGATGLPAAVKFVPGELIEDREVSVTGQDELGHVQLAQQLASLAATVPMPTNVALYGPWGSGKTGIGNLVRAELAKHGGKISYARFDAFKYAQNPLRRNFVSAVAKELGITDRRFHEDLYTAQVKTDYEIPASSILTLLGIFLGLAALITSGLLLLVVLVAWVRGGDFSDGFRELSSKTVGAALAPAALLAAVIALVGKAFGVERRTDKADSDEEFEKVFLALIDEAKKGRVERIVVFVDELDRCASEEVVATLDAVRTFLGVTGCVFIVAADRQVVEEALCRDVRQATPADTVNPYYSAGSAYLDKVFQYQVTVPPLLPHSITKYAAGLVLARPGVWSELGTDLDVVVSVLVPSHVRSPRRVKNLLNAFVLAYRLAEARQADGELAGMAAGRADEIARLSCLRVEFPLFARDLVLDARLPEYVLGLSTAGDGDDFWSAYPHATDEVKQLAEDYAGLRAPVATLLGDEPDRHAQDADDEHGADDEPREPEGAVQKQHGRQLVDYLSRTRDVAGPKRDLLFLQSPGSVVGIEPEIAETIERAAGDGATQQILAAVQDMTEEQTQSVLTLLSQQANGAIGLEARNVATSLLAVAALPTVSLDGRADALVEAMAPAVDAASDRIGAASLPGAWRLGLAGSRPTALKLRQLVLRSDAAQSDPDVGLMVLADASEAVDADAARTAELLVAHLFSPHGDRAAAVIVGLPPEGAVRLLRASRDVLQESLSAFLALADTAPTAPAAAAAGAAGGAAAPVTAIPTAEDVTARLELLGRLVRETAAGDHGPAQEALCVLLGVDDLRVHTLIEQVIADAGPVRTPELVARVLTVTHRRRPQVWQPWLDAVPVDAAAGHGADRPLANLARLLWTEAVKTTGRLSDEQLVAAAARLATLIEQRPAERRPDLTADVRSSLGDPAEDDEDATARLAVHSGAAVLLNAGILPPGVLVQAEAADLTATLAAAVTSATPADPLVRYVADTTLAVLNGWPSGAAEAQAPSDEQARSVVDAVRACTWLPEPIATTLPLLAGALHPGSQGHPAPTAAAMDALRLAHGPQTDGAIGAWIAITIPTPADLATATRTALAGDRPAPALLGAVGEAADRLTARERGELLAAALADINAPPPTEAALHALRTGIADRDVARTLSDRYGRASNNPQRHHVLELWDRAGIAVDAARKHLIENVLMPLFALNSTGGNAAAAEMGLDYLARLAKPFPSGTKKQLGQAVVDATHPHGLENKAKRAMKDAGYGTRSKGWFRGDEIDVG